MTQNIKSLKPGSRVERTFAFERAAIDEASRTIELAFSSEQPYERWWGIEILDHAKKSVRLDRIKTGGPLLCDHDTRDHIGIIESVRIDADLVGRAVVRFGKSARAEEIYQDVLDGIRKNVSVGYIIHDAKLIEKGDSVTDSYRVTDWEPYEVSLVACPADSSVGIGRSMEDSPVIYSEPTPEIKNTQETDMSETNHAAEIVAAETRAADAAIKAESKRTNEIIAIGEGHAEFGGVALALKAVSEGHTVETFQKALLAAKRGNPVEIRYGNVQVTDNLTQDPKRGFRNYGDFCTSIVRAASDKGLDERLVRAASTFGNESSGPDGGYAVPPEFSAEILRVAYAEESLLARCDNTPISGNSMTFPRDETTPWGSSGVTASWEAEGSQSTPKKPALGESQLKLRKLKVLVAASDEMLSDASAMSSYITSKMGEAVDWKANDAIINGTGAGMPLGILKAASLVAQAKETSQTATTINAQNIAKMYGRVIKGAGSNLVWLMNPDAFQQIVTLQLGNEPIWMPDPSGYKTAPDGLLLGRPIVLTDACATVGAQGDIILANMSGYRAITKAGGAEFATSMHLWFDQDLMAFRLVFRMDGQPALSQAITPPNSAVTRSHFVGLAVRS